MSCFLVFALNLQQNTNFIIWKWYNNYIITHIWVNTRYYTNFWIFRFFIYHVQLLARHELFACYEHDAHPSLTLVDCDHTVHRYEEITGEVGVLATCMLQPTHSVVSRDPGANFTDTVLRFILRHVLILS